MENSRAQAIQVSWAKCLERELFDWEKWKTLEHERLKIECKIEDPHARRKDYSLKSKSN